MVYLIFNLLIIAHKLKHSLYRSALFVCLVSKSKYESYFMEYILFLLFYETKWTSLIGIQNLTLNKLLSNKHSKKCSTLFLRECLCKLSSWIISFAKHTPTWYNRTQIFRGIFLLLVACAKFKEFFVAF